MEIIKRLINTNYTEGRSGDSVKKIVLHTVVGSNSPYHWFNNPEARSSAHYWVSKEGRVEQFVEDSNTAWHSGDQYINLQSIGIEHDDDGSPYDATRTNELYESSAQLVALLCKKYDVPCKLVDSNDKWEWGINSHKKFSSTECPAGLDVNRIVNRAKEILDSENKPEVEPCDCEKLQETIKTLEKQHQDDLQVIQELQRDLEALQLSYDEMAKKYENLVLENEKLEAKVIELSQELTVKKGEVVKLELEKKELEAKLKDQAVKTPISDFIIEFLKKLFSK